MNSWTHLFIFSDINLLEKKIGQHRIFYEFVCQVTTGKDLNCNEIKRPLNYKYAWRYIFLSFWPFNPVRPHLKQNLFKLKLSTLSLVKGK